MLVKIVYMTFEFTSESAYHSNGTETVSPDFKKIILSCDEFMIELLLPDFGYSLFCSVLWWRLLTVAVFIHDICRGGR